MDMLRDVVIDEARWPRMFARLRRAGFSSRCGCNGCASCQASARRFVRGLTRAAHYSGRYRPGRWGSRYSVYTRSIGNRRLRLIVDTVGDPAIMDVSTDGPLALSPLAVEVLDWPNQSQWEGEYTLGGDIDVTLTWNEIRPGGSLPGEGRSVDYPEGANFPVIYIIAKKEPSGDWTVRKVGHTGKFSLLRGRFLTFAGPGGLPLIPNKPFYRDLIANTGKNPHISGHTLYYATINPPHVGHSSGHRQQLETVLMRTLDRKGLTPTNHEMRGLANIGGPININNPLPEDLRKAAGYPVGHIVSLSPGQTYEISPSATGYSDPTWAKAIGARVKWPGGAIQMEKLKRIPSTIRNHPKARWQGPLTFQDILTDPSKMPRVRGLYFIVWPHGAYLGMSAAQGDGIRARVVDHIREHHQFTFESTGRGRRKEIKVYWLNLNRLSNKSIENLEKAYLNSIIGVRQDTALRATWERRKKYLAAGLRNLKELEDGSLDEAILG